ncbi:serine/threonine protein kinase [Noviherbaspirillum sedimenti]|uniref:non-specific serine/threonine protein kinase n=2 Tax=Noviherbaspirillum sedimenti TaxID=2320865 RepID=A0A3A3G766_9BURK|nr:serine/threonine protein kinase [Noviherbaspirillum sedimenti]
MTLATAIPISTATVNRIGRFRIIRELGRGTIGCVYLGHDPVIDREVAIKTFLPSMSAVERKRIEEQFINEARASGRLNHTNIVTIYEAYSEGGTTYIAMEYLQGTELHRLLATQHKFATSDVASIIYRLANALDFAHNNNVVHRDIKPANIFLVADNQPKLMDFGIARAPNRVADEFAGSDDAPFTLYCKENLLGTPNYMSPEQATYSRVDHRTDIYSLGAVMYEMLTGRRPFVAENVEKLLEKIAHRAPKAPHEINPEVPEGLSAIVMRAMSKRPEKRYASAHDMAEEIKRYVLAGQRRRREDRMRQGEEQRRRTDRPQDGTSPGLLDKLFRNVLRKS